MKGLGLLKQETEFNKGDGVFRIYVTEFFIGIKNKWATIFTVLSVLVLVIAVPRLVAKIVMTLLSMIMIYASAGAIKQTN